MDTEIYIRQSDGATPRRHQLKASPSSQLAQRQPIHALQVTATGNLLSLLTVCVSPISNMSNASLRSSCIKKTQFRYSTDPAAGEDRGRCDWWRSSWKLKLKLDPAITNLGATS